MSIPAEHLRVYARSLGLPEDSDLATVAEAIRACKAAGVARPDQIPPTPKGAIVANYPLARDCRTATLAAKAAAKLATDWRAQPPTIGEISDKVLAMAAEGALVEFVNALPDAELVDLYNRLRAANKSNAANAIYRTREQIEQSRAMQAPFAGATLPASSAPVPLPGQLSAREKEYCAQYGTDERLYVRMRDDRDRKAAAQKLAKDARLKAQREATARHVANLRGAR